LTGKLFSIPVLLAALAGTLLGIALVLGAIVFYLAKQGTQRHREYAREAAAVDGELVDIIGNFNVVRAFGATFREQRRIDERMGTEMAARRRSLYYLEHIRLVHAILTALLTVGVVAWAIILWQHGQAGMGQLGPGGPCRGHGLDYLRGPCRGHGLHVYGGHSSDLMT